MSNLFLKTKTKPASFLYFLQLMRDMCVFWTVLSTRTARPSSPAASTSVCVVTDRSPACRAATWTWCCPVQTAPCHGGFSCLESAARSGCVIPRLRPVHWVALPWQVSETGSAVRWDGLHAQTDIDVQSPLPLWRLCHSSARHKVKRLCTFLWPVRGKAAEEGGKEENGIRGEKRRGKAEEGDSVVTLVWNVKQ